MPATLLFSDTPAGTLIDRQGTLSGGRASGCVRYTSAPVASKPGYCGMIIDHRGTAADVILIDVSGNKQSGLNSIAQGLIASLKPILLQQVEAGRLPPLSVHQIRWWQAFEWDFTPKGRSVPSRNVTEMLPAWSHSHGRLTVLDIEFELANADDAKRIGALIDAEMDIIKDDEPRCQA